MKKRGRFKGKERGEKIKREWRLTSRKRIKRVARTRDGEKISGGELANGDGRDG